MKLFDMKIGKHGRKNAQKGDGMSIREERKHLLSPKSDFFVREAYKVLRTNVSFALAGDEGCKVVVVTSAMQSEGKSTTAVNLAITYAMADYKVLIIDCDLRRPKLARLLQLSSKAGLSNLIVNPKLKDQAIVSTDVCGLDVLLSGDIPPNPSELLGSSRMQQLLAELRESYDMIILDSPPINLVTDTAVLAPKSDGVLFLVRANQSDRGAVIHGVEQLEYVQAKILGFVLNGVDMENAHYGHMKYRNKRYGGYRQYGYDAYGYSSYGSDGRPSRSFTNLSPDKLGDERA